MDINNIKERIKTYWSKAKPYVMGIVKPLYFPSDNQSRKKRWLINAGKIVGHLIACILIFILLVYVGAFGKLPDKSELRSITNCNASTIYSADKVQLGRIYRQNRLSVDSTKISKHIINALVATEDSRFFEHHGVDARSTMRVLFRTFLMFDTNQGGGSTISQQLAKNLYPRKSYGPLTYPVAKVKEIIIAQRIEETYTKEEILTLYLNTVPFGENVYGIEAASQRFFGRKAQWLDPPAAATLIGMLAANSAYNPRLHPEQSTTRRNTVLSRMAKAGYIDSLKLEKYQAAPLGVKYQKVDNETGLGIFFRAMIANEAQIILDDMYGEGEYNLYTDGLEIHTTLNSKLQNYAEKAVAGHMKTVQDAFDKQWKGKEPWGQNTSIYTRAYEQSERYKTLKGAGVPIDSIIADMERPTNMIVYNASGRDTAYMSPADSVRKAVTALNTGFLAVDPKSGDILAWVGGINRHLSQTDHVNMKRQVGSTFKPIVYAAALENGIEPSTYIENKLRTYDGKWTPSNSDGKYGGWYSLKGALSKSLNTVSAYLIDQIGPSSVVALAHGMGIESKIPEVPSIALGTAEISLYEMVKAYQAFATGGITHDLRTITTIKDSNGKVLYSASPSNGNIVMSESTAIYVNDMMKAVVDSGTARSIRNVYKLPGDIAGKTGTTQNGADGWFIAATPNVVAGAWVGCDNPSIRFKTGYYGQGAYMALPIVGRFLTGVSKMDKYSGGAFPAPLDEDMEMNMSLPLRCEEEPNVEELKAKNWAIRMDEDTTDISKRPIRKFFKNIMDNIFGGED